MEQNDPNIAELWEKWHKETYGSSVAQYMERWGWRTVAWKFAMWYAAQTKDERSK